MELQALERVRADGGGYALALPGKDGRALHARSQDKQHRAQLVGRIAKLQALLKLAAPMQRVDPEGFKHAQQLLTRWEVEKLHSRVEEQVSALQVLRLEREQGLHGSGRNASFWPAQGSKAAAEECPGDSGWDRTVGPDRL